MIAIIISHSYFFFEELKNIETNKTAPAMRTTSLNALSRTGSSSKRLLTKAVTKTTISQHITAIILFLFVIVTSVFPLLPFLGEVGRGLLLTILFVVFD